MSALPETDTIVELTQVLYREARLLDDGEFEQWLDLLHENLTYVAPIRQDVAARGNLPPERGPHELRYFNESAGSLRLRVAKIRTGLAQTEYPASRVVRLISNVEILAETAPGEHPVRSAFLIHRQHRQRDIEVLAGHRRDSWRREPDGWRLKHREILFAANVLPVQTLPLFY